jgi:hypothetical protein
MKILKFDIQISVMQSTTNTVQQIEKSWKHLSSDYVGLIRFDERWKVVYSVWLYQVRFSGHPNFRFFDFEDLLVWTGYYHTNCWWRLQIVISYQFFIQISLTWCDENVATWTLPYILKGQNFVRKIAWSLSELWKSLLWPKK